ncbi:AAA family ATPase [Kaistella sp. G5-32]|uniref:AAA family ATPase n=1 Tax=Kaistella gelatinilytica TaxID=2787636 RepID=A0ABS0FBR0_9FLAO|nr:AAA family ATPase [Kaistella gelatinilytica]MBF8457145.1 AAA family ATPase [Kaistella gelatinilytica]
MIKNILLKNIASYDAENGVEIPDLKKVNFFFGANGSGKSTIAKYLSNLTQSSPPNAITDYGSCTNNGYDSANHQILVYDENFIDVNFNQNSLLRGVFSLNETNEIIDRQISEKHTTIRQLQDQKLSKQLLIPKVEDNELAKKTELLSYCWTERNAFSPLSKLNLDYSGSRPNHLNKLKELKDSVPNTLPTIAELTSNYNDLYEKELTEIEVTVNSTLYRDLRVLEKELQPLLNEIIIGNEDVNIDSLIKALNSRNWVETGVELLNENDSICPFCQKETIDAELRIQFDQYFDETSKLQIQRIEYLLSQYKIKTNSILENIIAIQNIFNLDNIVSNVYLQLQQLFNSNIDSVTNKIQNSNERKEITSINTLKSGLSTIIKKIKANNQCLIELDQNKSNLISKVWIFMTANCKNRIEEFEIKKCKYERIYSLANQMIAIYDENIIITRQEIDALRQLTVTTQDAVENINVILNTSGFESFEIEEKEVVNNISQYYLKRPNSSSDEQIFRTLSEGEKSFISFLYFYQLCLGTDDIVNNGTKKKIIVIDDPVSSLDSQALFVVSSLIHQLILRKGNDNVNKKMFKNENIAQVFIFTHNLYFYKEVSFDKRPMCTDYWHFKISKINNNSNISGRYNKSIKDDYAMLWDAIKELKANLPQDSNLNILIANSMRRIIESYVHFIGIGNDAWSSILGDDRQSPEYYIKYAFIASLNDESHRVTALDGIYYQKISSEQPQLLFDVFREIFEFIGKNHYEMMMD